MMKALAVAGNSFAVDATRLQVVYPVSDDATEANIDIYRTAFPFKDEGDTACLLERRAGIDAPRSAGIRHDELLMNVVVSVGDASVSRKHKAIDVEFVFGATEVGVTATARATGESVTVRRTYSQAVALA